LNLDVSNFEGLRKRQEEDKSIKEKKNWVYVKFSLKSTIIKYQIIIFWHEKSSEPYRLPFTVSHIIGSLSKLYSEVGWSGEGSK
jgi:hypothetical protein